MTPTPRDRARARTMQDIVRIGREHLATTGPGALSLRAVARDLGVVSSAVYRYVRSRDELLTLLVIDAYDELGDAVDAAVVAVGRETSAGEELGRGRDVDDRARDRFLALGRAVRSWALREPAGYALLFGTPVPGYDAPGEETTGPGTRVIVALIMILERAHGDRPANALDGPALSGSETVPEALKGDFSRIRDEYGLSVPDPLLARGVLVWSALFGAVSFEVFGQYGAGTFSDPGALFEMHLARLADLLII